jgi:protein-S-isoprenylcysteine O-methyltransferase Ste14
MSIFALQMLVIAFVGKNVRERGHIPKEARRNRLEKYTGATANILWLLALAYSIFLPFQLGTIWFYIGLFGFIVGAILMTTATFDFITANSDQVITKGAYRFSRHPMYLAIMLICLGAGIASLSFLFILLTTAMAFCLHKEASIEERYCLGKYGRAYQKYLNEVPRWIGLPQRMK